LQLVGEGDVERQVKRFQLVVRVVAVGRVQVLIEAVAIGADVLRREDVAHVLVFEAREAARVQRVAEGAGVERAAAVFEVSTGPDFNFAAGHVHGVLQVGVHRKNVLAQLLVEAAGVVDIDLPGGGRQGRLDFGRLVGAGRNLVAQAAQIGLVAGRVAVAAHPVEARFFVGRLV
nr:hypothetical protein [Tanacetum cinerariifolium]